MSIKLDTSNGNTLAFVQLAQWTQYDRMTCNAQRQWNHLYYLAVSSWAPYGYDISKTVNIRGSSAYTDRDDQTNVYLYSSEVGQYFPSVDFYSRYSTMDRSHSGGGTFQVSSSRLFTIGGGISFGGSWFSFDAIRADVSAGSGNYYTYTMPSATIRADYLSGSTNGWAFCSPGMTSC